jgi:aerobic C4-dicarboxylate transport protein
MEVLVMTTNPDRTPLEESPKQPERRDRTHWLYVAVLVAVAAGVVVGLLAPSVGRSVGVLGTMFVDLIKMIITPVIFCTIVLGIGSLRKAATIGKVGGLALVYFVTMSTFALAIGLVVGNLLHPGANLQVADDMSGRASELAEEAHSEGGLLEFIQSIIPDTLFSALTSGNVLQALFLALITGFAIQALPRSAADPALRAIEVLQKVVFKILVMILWLAPIGAFGAIANVVARTGWDAVVQLMTLMLGFYITCVIFVFGVLGALLWVVARVSIFKLARYLAREYLLIVATSSSESALPRLIAKMEHLGVDRSTTGVVVPTGYSFNLDGTAIYLTMASLFIAEAMGKPLSLGEQISLLVFMIVASKGAAGVTGAGLAVLAGGLQSHRPDLLDGVGLIVGIDRFMSEARALTNFSGNAVATLLVGTWTNTVDKEQVDTVLRGEDPFDEMSMLDEDDERRMEARERGEEPAHA